MSAYTDLKQSIIAHRLQEGGALRSPEILRMYAQSLTRNLKVHMARPRFRELTAAVRQEILQRTQRAPPPSPKPAPSAKGKAVVAAAAGATSALCKLIFIPAPPGGGKGSYMYGRAACMDSDCFAGELKPR